MKNYKFNINYDNKTILSSLNNIRINMTELLVIIITAITGYYLYVLNQLTKTTIDQIEGLSNKIQQLEQQLRQKDLVIASLQEKMSLLQEQSTLYTVDNTKSALTLSASSADAELLRVGNDMLKFYIVSGGIVIAALLLLYIFYSYSTSWSFLKVFLPTPIYNKIVDIIPFLREVDTYMYTDTLHNYIWKVNVINHKSIEILVKTCSDTNFINVTDFVTKLLQVKGATPVFTKAATELAVNTSNINSAAAMGEALSKLIT